MLSSKSRCRHLASRIQQNKTEVPDFTAFTLTNSPFARAAGLNHLKEPMGQPLTKTSGTGRSENDYSCDKAF